MDKKLRETTNLHVEMSFDVNVMLNISNINYTSNVANFQFLLWTFVLCLLAEKW